MGTDESHKRLQKRPFGHTDVELSIIGLGAIVVRDMEHDDIVRLVDHAIERGVNYFDMGPGYGDAELRFGPVIERYRQDIFLSCKTNKRDAAAAREDFEGSLKRLHTDHFDLYQLHAISDVAKDVDAAFAPGGVMELLEQEKQAGRIRYLGFSAHTVEAAMAAMDCYDFDSILFPINFACYRGNGFGPLVVAKAQEKRMAILALKAMARQVWAPDHPRRQRFNKAWYEPITERRLADLALRFTLSQPVTASLPPGDEELFRMAVDLALDFRPITDGEQKQLDNLAATLEPIFAQSQ